MRALIHALALVALVALLAGCDYPPTAGFVTDPPATAAPQLGGYAGAQSIEIAASTAVGVVFLAYDASTFSGTSPATEARSLDESVARVVPTDRQGTVQYGSPSYVGRVFVVYGVAPGATEIEVLLDGASAGTMPITVDAQP